MAEEQDREAELLADVERLRNELQQLKAAKRRPTPEILDGVVARVEAEDVTEQKLIASDGNGDATTATPPVVSEPTGEQLLQDRVSQISTRLGEAFSHGRFMVAIWYVDRQNMIMVNVHRHNFGLEDLDSAISGLRNSLQQSVSPPPGQALPRAAVTRPKPLDIMFGQAKTATAEEPEEEEQEDEE